MRGEWVQAMTEVARDALDALFEPYPETLTVSEVAKLLRKTTAGVYGMCKSGRLPAYQVAGSWLVLRDALKEQMRQGSAAGHTEEYEQSEE